jgi:site-specific DNA-methyltransferase (adenine-specific)
MQQQILNIDWKVGIREIQSNTVDLIVTDPPYGMKFQSCRRSEQYKSIENDDNLDWLDDWTNELYRVCKPEAHLYIFCSWHNIDKFKQSISRKFNVKNILIWEKNNHGSGDLEGDYAPKYEMILFCSNGAKKLNGGRDSNIIKSPKTGNNNHPTEKPIDLISYLIRKSSEEGDLVLDTFAGVCPVAVASKQLNRNAICFEIESEYSKIGQEILGAANCFLI